MQQRLLCLQTLCWALGIEDKLLSSWSIQRDKKEKKKKEQVKQQINTISNHKRSEENGLAHWRPATGRPQHYRDGWGLTKEAILDRGVNTVKKSLESFGKSWSKTQVGGIDLWENLSLREWLKPSRTLTCRIRPKKDWQTRQWVHYKMAECWFPRCRGSQAGFEVTSAPDWLHLAVSGSIHSPPSPFTPIHLKYLCHFLSVPIVENVWEALLQGLGPPQ